MANDSKPRAPRYPLKHSNLEEFEALVYRRDHNAAARALQEMFRNLRIGSEFVGLHFLDEGERPRYFARLACAIASLVCDPGFNFTDEGYAKFLIEHGMIEATFEASALRSADHLAQVLAEKPEDRRPEGHTYTPENLAKWMLFHGLGSSISVDYDDLFGRSEAIARMFLPLWAAMLGQPVVLTERAHERREQLAAQAHRFAGLRIPDVAIPPLADAYMYASYGTQPDRHELKRVLSDMFARAVKEELRNLPTAEALADRRRAAGERLRDPAFAGWKPRMLVPLEHFNSFHAMFRCYAPVLRQLAARFRLVAMARPSALDDASRALFSEVRELPNGALTLSAIVDEINAVAPDIIYYPSVGMAFQWAMLACARLAPVQAMTLGHPASTFSPEMDYCVADGGAADQALFSERVVSVDERAFRFVKRPDMPERRPEPRAPTGLNAIAVPAMVLKLNAPFLKVLREIQDDSESHGEMVQFQFWPSLLGVHYWQARRLLEEAVPGCKVHGRVDYEAYMAQLGECDLALCPFPFGGTNSTVDALWLGLPVVTLWGDQPHGRFDAMILRRCALGDMVAGSVEEFKATARRMMDAAQRALISERLAKVDLEQEFFGAPPPAARAAYADAFWNIFKWEATR